MLKYPSFNIRIVLAFSLTCWIAHIGQGQEVGLLERIEMYVNYSKDLFEVPGMTVTIVKDGNVLLSKGYGERSIKDESKMDAQTIFPMASTTKAITAVAMGILIDRDSLTWRTKIKEVLPRFELGNPFVTDEITVKDLFTHNTGLTNTDLLWTLWDYSQEEILLRLKDASLDYSLRDGHRYQNIMYMIAGLVIEEISGKSWGDFIQEEILNPIGMTSTCPTLSCAYQNFNRSIPHGRSVSEQRIIEIIDSAADTIDAAGSAWTNSTDAALWLQFMIDSARVNGKQLISTASYKMITSPQKIIPEGSFYVSQKYTNPHFRAYGLGWYMHDYGTETVLFHTGSLNGAKAIAGFIPSQKIGVYISSNIENAEIRHGLMYWIFDVLLGKEPRDWSQDIKGLYDASAERRLNWEETVKKERIKYTEPTLPLSDYVGVYNNLFLGNLRIDIVDGALRITTREDRHIVLTHWHYDTFMGVVEEYARFEKGSLIDFDIDRGGVPDLELYGHIFKKLN